MTPEQREELKPCPFCGGSVTLERAMRIGEMGPRDWWGVKCRNTMNLGGTCAIEQIPSGSAEAAIERWNRRAQVEALTVPQWISVETALPKCSKKPNSLGVEVIVYPQPESGESSAFFGCRVTDKPGFYKYGHMVKGVTHWMYIPTIPAIPGTKEGA